MSLYASGLPAFNAAHLAPPQQPPRTLWLITIVDLVTLLLAFFVLMFSMTQIEAKRFSALAKSYGSAFSATPPQEHQPLIKLPKIENVSGEDLGYLEAVLKAAFAGSATLKDVQFHRTPQYLILSLPADGLFAADSGVFKEAAVGPAFDLGGVLSNLKNRIAVVGTAVTTQESGAQAWALAVARARTMADSLKSAGYQQPLTVLGRGADATDVEAAIGRIDILIMPEQPTS